MTEKHFEKIVEVLIEQVERKENEIFCLKYDIEQLKNKIAEMGKETKK